MPITVYHILLYKRLNIVVGSQSLADRKTRELERNQNPRTSSVNGKLNIFYP